MAYAEVAVTTLVATGTRFDAQGTAGSAGGPGTGLKFKNDGNTFLIIENTGVGTPAVVIETGALVAGLAVADQTVTLVASQNQIAGPFPLNPYQSASGTQYVQVNFSGGDETDATIMPFKLKK